MKETSLGTIRGVDRAGKPRTLAIAATDRGYCVTGADLERRVIAANEMGDLLDKVNSAYALTEAEFIPAHGARGARGV